MSDRQTYEQQVDTRFVELSDEMERLVTKRSSMKDPTKISVFEAVLATLRQKKLILETRIQHLKHAKDADWEDLKTTVNEALDDMKTAVKKAVEKFVP